MVFSWFLACSGGEEDSGDLAWGPLGGDSATNGDSTGDTSSGDTGTYSGAGFPKNMLMPPEGLIQGETFTIPVDRGLAWEWDSTFSIDGRARPQLFQQSDGTLVMTVQLVSEGKSLFALTSTNGSAWDRSSVAFLEPELFAPLNCGNKLEDAYVTYLPDATFLLIAEGSYDPELDGDPEWTTWCRATSATGETFSPDVSGYAFEGGDSDVGHPGDPGGILLSDYTSLVYYNSEETHDLGGIRALIGGAPDWDFTAVDEADVLIEPDVEPAPVYLEGGGVRVYYTLGEDGGIGEVDFEDGVTASGDMLALANPDADCSEVGAVCYRDPVVVHLVDDRIAMYFTMITSDSNGYSYAIQRAWATD